MKSHFLVRSQGFQTHYLTWEPLIETQKLPVICIHGNLTNARMYRWMGEALSSGKWGGVRRVLAIDMRGCGDSGMPKKGFSVKDMASDIEAVLQHEGIERAHFIAFSRGVLYTAQLALLNPGLIQGFVAGDYPPQAAKMTDEFVDRILSNYMTFKSWEELYTFFSPNGELSREEFESHKDEMFRETDGLIHKRYSKELPKLLQKESEDLNLWESLRHIKGPLLLLKGDGEGSLITKEQAEMYKTFYSATKVVRIAEAGHDVFYPRLQTEQVLNQYFTGLE